MINSNVSNVNVYVGSDGKIHFKNSAGADTALNFSSGSSLSGKSMQIYLPITYSAGNGDPVTISVNGVNKVHLEYWIGQSNYFKLGYKINGASSYTFTSIMTKNEKYTLDLDVTDDKQPLILISNSSMSASTQDITVDITFD